MLISQVGLFSVREDLDGSIGGDLCNYLLILHQHANHNYGLCIVPKIRIAIRPVTGLQLPQIYLQCNRVVRVVQAIVKFYV